MNLTEIRKLIKMLENSDITEIEVSEGETSVRLSRQSSVLATPVAPQVVAAVAAPVAVASDTPVVSSDTVESDEEHLVKSPMVGTYYSSPSPDAEPFIVEGKAVKKGETLCIIEAMKLMNEIEAEYNGVVEKILVDNATPLEFGQAMFVVKPT